MLLQYECRIICLMNIRELLAKLQVKFNFHFNIIPYENDSNFSKIFSVSKLHRVGILRVRLS